MHRNIQANSTKVHVAIIQVKKELKHLKYFRGMMSLLWISIHFSPNQRNTIKFGGFLVYSTTKYSATSMYYAVHMSKTYGIIFHSINI